MDTSSYKKLFLDEAREHLRLLNEGFVALERNPASLDGVAELFRNAHSLKGMSSSMGYDPITALAHALEDLLDLVRNGRLEVSSGLIDLFLTSVDRVEKMVGEVAAGDRRRGPHTPAGGGGRAAGARPGGDSRRGY
jgi:two-component system chemotaxis sensor kinase CheA